MKKPQSLQQRGNQTDATHQFRMEMQILGLRKRGGYTMQEALDLCVPPEDEERCAHCHRLFHRVWNKLVRRGDIEIVR